MGKGKGKKGGKKKKGPAFYTGDVDMKPFGFKVRDIVQTPLGLSGTVIGVKYEGGNPENRDSARLWVEYPGGRQAPLEPRPSQGFIGSLGYKRSSDADHIWRDVVELREKMRIKEEERQRINELNRLRTEALNLAAAVPKGKKAAAPAKRPQTAG